MHDAVYFKCNVIVGISGAAQILTIKMCPNVVNAKMEAWFAVGRHQADEKMERMLSTFAIVCMEINRTIQDSEVRRRYRYSSISHLLLWKSSIVWIESWTFRRMGKMGKMQCRWYGWFEFWILRWRTLQNIHITRNRFWGIGHERVVFKRLGKHDVSLINVKITKCITDWIS